MISHRIKEKNTTKLRVSHFLLLTLFVCSGSLTAQNLVYNGDFEDFINCPTTLDQLNYASGWQSFGETPDYFNGCSSVSAISPPTVGFGYQLPYSGNAFAGFIAYDISGTNYREVLGTQLLSPLVIGTRYYFSCFISFAGIPNYTSLACNKLGFKFSTSTFSFGNPIPIDNSPQYYSTEIISDTSNWIQLRGSFLADSAYNFLAVGNFFDDGSMGVSDTVGMAGSNNFQSYYYIDNVTLSSDSTVGYATGISEQSDDLYLLIYPNPCVDELFLSSDDEITSYEVYNILGVQCFAASFNSSKFQKSINVSVLASGSYVLCAHFSNRVVQKMFHHY